MTRMTEALSKPAEDALATFRHHDGLARMNARKAEAAMDLFLSLMSQDAPKAATGRVPNCVKVWRNWLAVNGPATRQTITDATGVKFNERGTPHTVKWSQGDDDTASVSPNTITRFLGLKKDANRGSPPTIYALWSQRYEVRPLFGVGPFRPDTGEGPGPLVPQDIQSNEPESEPTEALTGVVRPPIPHPDDCDRCDFEGFDPVLHEQYHRMKGID